MLCHLKLRISRRERSEPIISAMERQAYVASGAFVCHRSLRISKIRGSRLLV